MFEFLPRADANKPVDQQPITQTLRENREATEEAQRRRDQTTVWDGIGAAAVNGGVGFIDRFVTELGFEPEPEFRIPDDARKRWETLGIRPEQSVETFLGGLPGRYRPAEGPCKAQGALFTLDSATGLCTAVERVDIR